MFTNSISPALQSPLEAQCNFATELSRKLFETAQRVNELNLRLLQDLLQEMTTANQHILTARDAGDAMITAASHVQPGTDKLLRYQQQLSNLLTHGYVEINRTAETHVPVASRTAVAYADELVRKTAEETEKATQRQRELIQKMQVSTHSDGAGRQRDQGGQPGQAH